MARTSILSRSTHNCYLYDATTGDVLLLDGCCTNVLIVDIHASVTLSQRFTNTSSTAVSSAVYTFGLMSGSAVCGFEMIKPDGTRVEGVVKEREEASREYEQAIKAGKTASLGQQETADVFSIAVGNILPSETVEIHLRYLQLLMDDEKKDQVKFIFPRTYAQRYGQAPTNNSSDATTAHQAFKMNVIVQQSGVIKSISCPSAHPIQLELGFPDGFEPLSEDRSHFASVKLTDTSGFLTQDVTLVVSATDLDSPRCFMERHPSLNHETTAMALTFVPRFTLPDIKGEMEYVFVVDRSGSMRGERIRLVREALVVLLRGLPTSGTTFNIISFGTNATKLWDTSRQYSQTTLEEATNHVDVMQADYGGTEIASALSLAYSSLPKPLGRPVAVILLTDGSAWDVSTCVSHTQTALSTLPHSTPDSFIRVFTVGIGDGASSDTCDSIARAGNGMAVYVKQGEAIAGKCARVVRAARSPQVVNIVVSWMGHGVDGGGADLEHGILAQDGDQEGIEGNDDDFEMVTNIRNEAESDVPANVAPLSLFNIDDDDQQATGPPPAPDPRLPPPPTIQQAPLLLTNIFPGTRTQVYAVIRTPQSEIDSEGERLPKSVKIRGVVSTTGTLVELDVPVSRLLRPLKSVNNLDSGDGASSSLHHFEQLFLHILAAKALIIDRQDGKHAFPTSIADEIQTNDELREAYLKKEIVRLGTTYGLTSKHTSFVAVDHRVVGGSAVSGSSSINHTSDDNIIPVSGLSKRRIAVQSQRRGSGKAARTQLAPMAARKAATPVTVNAPAGSESSSSSSDKPYELRSRREPSRVHVASRPRPVSFGTRSSTTTGQDQGPDQETPRKRMRSSKSSAVPTSTPPTTSHVSAPTSIIIPKTLSVSDRLTAIARLQQFNGITESVQEVEVKLAAVNVNGDVGATVMAWAWMDGAESVGDEVLGLKEKAREWVEGQIERTENFLDVKEKVLQAMTGWMW
ncbi:von Willebrand factor type A domain-containing protein [Lentinula detonsa]|uniref:von Willebrand factor type A domain-containing protein n=1 Tax=Lentinula detonsa TaxID=2804962 RepID=A0AA38PT91_9AGAR|nr:von Willebrand factor type A domain-containing protein [Lentinula detonsa]